MLKHKVIIIYKLNLKENRIEEERHVFPNGLVIKRDKCELNSFVMLGPQRIEAPREQELT